MKKLKTYNNFNESNVDILHTAFQLGYEHHITEYISDYSNDINIDIGRNTLPIEIIINYEDIKDKVLDNPSLDVTLTGEARKTLLMYACEHQQLDTVKKILKHKQNINELDDYDNDALIWLAPNYDIYNIKDYYELTELLLKNGANPNQKNINDLSSLEMFYQNIKEIIYVFSDSIKLIDLIKLYFKYGAKTEISDIIEIVDSISSFYNIQDFIDILEFYISNDYTITYNFIEKIVDHRTIFDQEVILREYLKKNHNNLYSKIKKKKKSRKFNL